MKTEEMIAVMQAHVRGEAIQCRNKRSAEAWRDPTPEICWNWPSVDYRIKPREPREWTLGAPVSQGFHPQSLTAYPYGGGEISAGAIHVREVIE